jgi:hypothetical protein
MKLPGRLLACLAALPAAAATIVIQDGTFNPTNWTTQTLTGSGPVSHNINQQNPGGNPGEYRRHIISWPQLEDQSINTSVASIFTAGSYDPSVSGAISNLAIQYDLARVSYQGNTGTTSFGTYAPLLTQGGSLYLFNVQHLTSSANLGNTIPSPWVTFSVDASNQLSWARISGAGPNNPDFGASGGLIQFGYRTNLAGSCAFVCSSATLGTGIDNFRVTIGTPDPPPGNGGGGGAPGGSEIPEPSTLLLSAGGLALLAAFRLQARR